MAMIAFGTRFNFRAAGVCIERGHVLLVTEDQIDFWYLPGGRCEIGETAAEALRREFREETGVEVHVGRLLWVAETFFVLDATPFHELALYFEATLPDDSVLRRTGTTYQGIENGLPLRFRWFPIASLPGTRLQPAFLRTALQALPPTPTHIVQRGAADGS